MENLNGDQDSLIYHEVLEDTQRAEIDEDFVQRSETPPSIDVQEIHSSSSGVALLNRALSRCLVILLTSGRVFVYLTVGWNFCSLV